MATPAHVFQNGYRHNPNVGLWGSDDSDLCRHVGRCGYVRGYDANHYSPLMGSTLSIPDYFARTLREGKPQHPVTDALYGPDFFIGRGDFVRASAAVVAPVVQALLDPESVFDVGCGKGEWIKAFWPAVSDWPA